MTAIHASLSSPERPSAWTNVVPVRLQLDELDPAIRPTDDLDGFVNARWRAAHPVPPDRSCWDCFTVLAEHTLGTCAAIASRAAAGSVERSEAERVVGDFWHSAMQGDRMQRPAREVLADDFAAIDALQSPAEIVRYLHQSHARGSGLLYRFEIGPDADDPSTYGARISQGGLGLGDPADYCDRSLHGQRRRDAYRSHIARMLAHGGLHAAQADRFATIVLAMEARLAAASLSRQALRSDVSLHHRRLRFAQACRDHPSLHWAGLFEAHDVEPPEQLSLPMPSFHATAASLLDERPVAHWRAYLRFHTLNRDAPWLDDESARLHHAFHGHWRGQQAPPVRWKRVLQAIDVHAGQAMGHCFVQHTLPAAARREVARMADQLRHALQRRIALAEWMSPASRARARRKLTAMQVKIGGPARPPMHATWPSTPHDWHANLTIARLQGQQRRVARLGQPVDPDDWSLLPQTVNARYEPQANAIVLPAAILQPPFFDPQADDALNFGGIGAVIAHEMTHAFDDQGSRFDAEGRLSAGWPPADQQRFRARASRLVDLIETFGDDHGTLDGLRTLGENIADFGGLAAACDAFLQTTGQQGHRPTDVMPDGYTRLQHFFLGWATIWRQNLSDDERRHRRQLDPHAPASVRVNAAAADLPAFAQAFGCRPGDRLWRPPARRAGIW